MRFTYAYVILVLPRMLPGPSSSGQLFPEADSILTAFSMICFCLFLDLGLSFDILIRKVMKFSVISHPHQHLKLSIFKSLAILKNVQCLMDV